MKNARGQRVGVPYSTDVLVFEMAAAGEAPGLQNQAGSPKQFKVAQHHWCSAVSSVSNNANFTAELSIVSVQSADKRRGSFPAAPRWSQRPIGVTGSKARCVCREKVVPSNKPKTEFKHRRVSRAAQCLTCEVMDELDSADCRVWVNERLT